MFVDVFLFGGIGRTDKGDPALFDRGLERFSRGSPPPTPQVFGGEEEVNGAAYLRAGIDGMHLTFLLPCIHFHNNISHNRVVPAAQPQLHARDGALPLSREPTRQK